ncbi:hypothetical protein B5G43_15100 [Flavonifractor sp. An92]|uniref:hypothetical protein n=1 Tax=Flavonifractor sp. An92 TaxID=1965666 RepID=UPI000B373F60|nr:MULTISPECIES: hypothetical protein [unclassified Flavonifractor]OUN03693.1 hypothetical protein B5G43_15100 [Flavonifractor sp. An92]OUQ24924.1 hypothetical protein B5E80_05600 [Flavonifractor sp. An135]
MKRPVLTLTRSKQLSALCWAVVLFFGALANWFPVKDLPNPLRTAVVGLLLVAAVVIILTTLGVWVEKGDERSAENERRTNSTLFTLVFLAMGALLVWMKNGQTLILGRSELLVAFGCVCLAQDILFLLYERFGA